MYIRNIVAAAAAAVIWGFPEAATATPQDDAARPPLYATNGDPALAALITEALERSPRLRRSLLESNAARERVPQAGALPNPVLSYTQHVQGPETRLGPQVSAMSLSQTFPWFGRRGDQRKVAEFAAARQNESYSEQQTDVIHQVKLVYYDLAYVDQALRIAWEEEQLLLHYETLAQGRYSQGFGQQYEVLHLQTEVTRIVNRQRELARQRVDLEATMNYLAGRPVHTPVPSVTVAGRPPLRIDAERLNAVGMAGRTEVRSARLQVESSDVALSLARRRYQPDVTVGLAWGRVTGRRDPAGLANPPPGNGRDIYSFTIGAKIPVFASSYDAGAREAVAQRAAAEAAYRDAADEVAVAIRSAAFRLTTIDDQVALFEGTLLPQAQQALHATEEAYSAGVTGVLELLKSEEMLLEVRLGQARLYADFMKALADMERAIGSAFPEEAS